MIILKGILILTFLVIIPLCIGILMNSFLKKEKDNLILAFVMGYLAQFAICQILTVPMIFLNCSFKTLLYTYIGIVCILGIVSVIINRKRWKEIVIKNINEIKGLPKVLTIITILLVAIQVYGLVGYMHEDADDAFYIGTATTTIYTNSLYKYSPTTGETEGDHLLLRYILGPFPVFHAINSAITSIHPTILAHSIMPIIFIPLAYMVYGLLANKLFKGKKENVMLFLIVLSIAGIWGNFSTRVTFSLLLFRIWQGKAVLANILIPAMWLLYLITIEEEYSLASYFMIIVTVFAGTFTTTMGIAFMPLALMLLTLVDELSKIDFKNLREINLKEHFRRFMNSFICCVPAIIYLIIYFVK